MSGKPVVVVTNWVHDSVRAFLAAQFELIANSERAPWPEDVRLRHIRAADAVMAFMTDKIDAEILSGATRLKMISCCLKGADNFDVDACSARGVLVSILPDELTAPGAELAIGMMIAAGRHMLQGDAYVRSGAFQGWRPHFYGVGLRGSVVGILGLGAVGRSIAESLRVFGAQTLYWDRQRADAADEERLGATFAAFEDVLSTSDYVVLALPLTSETRHIMDARALANMKPGAILINFARGSLVDEAAVASALRAQTLGFYAADVFECEDWAIEDRPPTVNPELLMLTEQTLFTPHLGSAVSLVRERMAMQAARNIVDFFAGKRPVGSLNAV